MTAQFTAAAKAPVDFVELADATMAAGQARPPASAMWYLSGRFDESGDVRYVPISGSPFRVGRRNDLSLCLPCKAVSSLHAEFIIDETTAVVRDLNSTNGTFVNGRRVVEDVMLRPDDLVQFANIPMRINRKAEFSHTQTAAENVGDQALALVRFDSLMADKAVVPFFQPIVNPTEKATVGYEVLGRSRLFGLRNPKQMFMAAAQLNLESELSRLLRAAGVDVGVAMPHAHPLYVNTHPLELTDTAALVDSLRDTREKYPSAPLMLEIHEAAAPGPDVMRELRAQLRDLDIGLAYDDFGAGQTRFVELVKVPPDVLKFDITLVSAIDRAPPRQRQMVGTLVAMARELGVTTLAEGIETEAEAQAIADLGFELAQGFFFGKPKPAKEFV